MTRSVSKMAVTLAGCLGLLGAGAAHGTSTAEVAVAANLSATSSVTRIESNSAPAAIIASDQRETNLQKTATLVIVSGFDSARRQRGAR
jgi:hypothetical protein